MNGASVLCWSLSSLVTFPFLINEISATGITDTLAGKQRKSLASEH